MAPSLTERVAHTEEQIHNRLATSSTGDKINLTPDARGRREPLRLGGVLDKFKSFDVTPVIGREFAEVDLAAWLEAPNSDELLRDLAIISICYITSEKPISVN